MSVFYNSQWFKYPTYRIAPAFTPRLLIQAESGSFEATNQYHGQRIVSRGTVLVDTTAPRSYLLTQLRNVSGTWTLIAANGYDVYGDTTSAGNARTFLQNFAAGDMLILNTWDEPYNNAVSYLYPTLTADFGSQINVWPRAFRDMHLLIAVKGRGVIYEDWRNRYNNAIVFSGWLP